MLSGEAFVVGKAPNMAPTFVQLPSSSSRWLGAFEIPGQRPMVEQCTGKQYLAWRRSRPSCSSPPLYKPAAATRKYSPLAPVPKPSTPPAPAKKRTRPTGVVIIPGYGSPASEYMPLRDALAEALGDHAVVHVASVTVATWARTLGGRPVTPVLEILDKAVQTVKESCTGKITLIGHSAGGWIARIWLSRTAEYCGRVWRGADNVDALICLGTPQQSSEPVTMRNMLFVNQFVPACAEAPKVGYVCVAGSGLEVGETEAVDRFWRLRFWDSTRWFARLSYELTDDSLKSSPSVGDGIVPTSVAFLEGAENILLEGIWHSPSSPGPWYGDAKAVEYWVDFIP